MKKKGSALILTVGIIALLLVLSAVVAQATTSTSITNTKMDSIDNLRLAAESGIEKGFSYIKKNYETLPIPVETTWSNNTAVKLDVEGGKYTVAVTLYNYDIDKPTDFSKYSIKSISTSKDGKQTKTITAKCFKRIETVALFDPFLDALINNAVSVINQVDDNKKKDFFINAGNNTNFTVKGKSYFQGKLKGGVFDKKSMSFTPVPVVIQSDNGALITAPPYNPTLVPAKPIYLINGTFKDSTGKPPVYQDFPVAGGTTYRVVLVNGDLYVSGIFTVSNTIVYCTGNAIFDRGSNIVFRNCALSAKTIDVSNHMTVLFDGVPNLTPEQITQIHDYIKSKVNSTTDTTQTSVPEGSLVEYTEK